MFVYERDVTEWALTKSITSDVRLFGQAIAVSGDTIAIGVPLTQPMGTVLMYQRSGGEWLLEETLDQVGPSRDDNGVYVSLSGDRLVAGMGGSDRADSYVREDGRWLFEATFVAVNDDQQTDRFGGSVAVSGETIAIGAVSEDSSGVGVNPPGGGADNAMSGSGAVYIFGPEAGQLAYVDADAPAGGDGGSWGSAFSSLQDALTGPDSARVVEIWVAEGVYFPDDGPLQTAGSREATFLLPQRVAIYGGFRGDETELSERDPAAHPTVLSGDIDGNDVNIDGNSIAESYIDIVGQNSLHVVTVPIVNSAPILDGLVITAGNASGGALATDSDGGGVFADGGAFIMRNCRVVGNEAAVDGGAIKGREMFATIEDSTFSGNRAGDDGGAIYVALGDVSMKHSEIRGNGALDRGGGFYCPTSVGQIDGCLVTGNTAAVNGGGLYIKHGATFSSSGCTISGNYAASSGGGIFVETVETLENQITVSNTVVWNNATAAGSGGTSASLNLADPGVMENFTLIEHSVFENVVPWFLLTRNLDGTQPENDPQFISPLMPSATASSGGDFHLAHGSPLIDAGGNHAALAEFDLEGQLRILNGDDDANAAVDIGAYERAPSFADFFPGLDPQGDENNNGVADVIEYAVGSDPASAHFRLPQIAVTDSGRVQLAVVSRRGADDIELIVETSCDLRSWQPLEPGEYFLSTELLADGFEKSFYDLVDGDDRRQFRLKVDYSP